MDILCLVASVWAEVFLIIAHFSPDQTQSRAPFATHLTACQFNPPLAALGLLLLTATNIFNIFANTLYSCLIPILPVVQCSPC